MKLFEYSVFIHAPPVDVFRVISDPRSKLAWVPAIRRVDMDTKGEPGLGTKYVASSGAGPFEFVFHERIVEWADDQCVAYEGHSPWGHFKTVASLESTSSGTTLHYRMDYFPPGGRLGEALLRILALVICRPMNAKAGERLKEVVESGLWQPAGI